MAVNYEFTSLPSGEELPHLTEKHIKNLYTDAYICYRYVKAIKTGNLPHYLASLKCGDLSHAGWLFNRRGSNVHVD